MNDTIVAISTALGVGAISIIRVSGLEARKKVNEVFCGKDLTKVSSHTIHYGYISDSNKKIDEVLVSVMKAPKTFTKEDVVEINCHGGISTTNKILELLLVKGCRLAEPGEFTKRAYLNGRIDLIEAESIMDIINSKTELARKLAINGINGKVSDLIKKLRKMIVEVLANIEVNIDYPEYEDAIVITNKLLKEQINYIEKEIDIILSKSLDMKIVKDGINIGIFGKPNVGKSSILNGLLEEEKAIVTNVQGTTRDLVEGNFILNGITINLIDTAGIRETDNIVEKIGIEKSVEKLSKVDLALVVLNNNEKLSDEDEELLEITENINRLIVINKNDLDQKLNLSKYKLKDIVYCDTKNNDGLNRLKDKIIDFCKIGKINENDLTYLSSARSISILKQVQKKIIEIKKAIDIDIPVDIIEIDLKIIWDLLGNIIGETYQEELIDTLFSQFCLGK